MTLPQKQNLFDFPMSQLFRDALDPDVQEIVEAERLTLRASQALRLAEDALEESLAQGARQWLHSRGYYGGRYFPENRLSEAVRKPMTTSPPKLPQPKPIPLAKPQESADDELKRF